MHASPLPGAADPFLALVEIIGDANELPGLERARRTSPDYERFMASLRSSRAPAEPIPIDRALRDRDALEAYLAAGGLVQHAHRLAHTVAEEGFLLVEGAARSRLGGPALLPPDAPRPSWNGSPLPFLAGFDLSELPPSRLPESGWLLFFGAVDADEADFEEPGAGVVLLALDVVEAAQGDEDLALRHVIAQPYLTLPYGLDVRNSVGLDVFEGRVYEELVDPLWLATQGEHDHWLGGHQIGAQGVDDDTGTALLLHMDWDEELGFEFLDAGTLQFRIPPDALATGDWSRTITAADSC